MPIELGFQLNGWDQIRNKPGKPGNDYAANSDLVTIKNDLGDD